KSISPVVVRKGVTFKTLRWCPRNLTGHQCVAPGSSLHRELQLLSASGLSPYEVMRSATVVPAAFLGKTKEFGTIAVGQRADLLLVAGNPLEDLDALKRPMGVIVRGRWLPREKLDELLKPLQLTQDPFSEPELPRTRASTMKTMIQWLWTMIPTFSS